MEQGHAEMMPLLTVVGCERQHGAMSSLFPQHRTEPWIKSYIFLQLLHAASLSLSILLYPPFSPIFLFLFSSFSPLGTHS
eukprot:gene820-458_t